MRHVPEMGWAELQTPVRNVRVGLTEVETLPPPGGGAVLTFGVENVDVAVERLAALDVRFDGEACTIEGWGAPRDALRPRRQHAHALPGPGAKAGLAPRCILRGVRILIAEDETIIRLDLRELLERAGFDVCAEAKDGLEAVELARSERPDLAVLDVKMPRLDGIEAARQILDERPIPIVMLTAYGQDELVSRAVETGVFGYLVKPFREQDLLPAIHAARARHDELAALREEADSLAEALAARKSIERAKGLLMEKEGLSEQDAFARLRKASQLSGRPLKVVAEALIATLAES
jgi:AmiR/NasT family two-component response regulator